MTGEGEKEASGCSDVPKFWARALCSLAQAQLARHFRHFSSVVHVSASATDPLRGSPLLATIISYHPRAMATRPSSFT